MRGDERVVETLNSLLADELTAINQYMVHGEMCEDWGYEKLGDVIEKRAIQEMKHAETLIGRILFLEGKPIVNKLKDMHIGGNVPDMFASDFGLEHAAIKSYNDAIQLCGQAGDYATREILEKILSDEDSHIDDIEETQSMIEDMGIQLFLSTRVT